VNGGSTGNDTQGAVPVTAIIGSVGATDMHVISTSDGDAGYFAKWMGSNINATNGYTKFTISSDQLTASANFTGSTVPNHFTDSFIITNSMATPTPPPPPPPGGGNAL